MHAHARIHTHTHHGLEVKVRKKFGGLGSLLPFSSSLLYCILGYLALQHLDDSLVSAFHLAIGVLGSQICITASDFKKKKYSLGIKLGNQVCMANTNTELSHWPEQKINLKNSIHGGGRVCNIVF